VYFTNKIMVLFIHMEFDMENTVDTGSFAEVRALINKGFDLLESEQSKINKAIFDAMPMEQRDKYCKSLGEQGVKAQRIAKLTGKSQPTINRHMNGKNS